MATRRIQNDIIMKSKYLLLQLFLTVMLLFNSEEMLASQPNPAAGDSIVRVGIMLNGKTLPDSLYMAVLTGGKQVEARKFMDAIGGEFYPISNAFHQQGLMVQYGRYISFARLGFAKGFSSLVMVDMTPPVTKQMVGPAGQEFFAPLGFLSRAIDGKIEFNPASGMIEVTVGSQKGFGSVFPPAADVASAFEKAGYIVRMGQANKQFPIEFCLAGYTPNANGNNVGVPYFGIQMPPPPRQDSMYSIPLMYNVQADEAVILIGKTPPECKYFSYRSYLYNRYYNFPNPPVRKKINASLGETTSLYRMRPDLPIDSMFSRKFAIIMAADSIVAMEAKATILAATTEIDPDDIHFDILPSGDLFRVGTGIEADWTNILHRVSLFKDTVAQNDYMNNPPLEVLQVSRKDSIAPVLWSVRPFLPRTSGITEFHLFREMGLLEYRIYEAFHRNYDLIWLSSTPFNLEAYTAIQQGVDAFGDNHDCLYVQTNDFLLGENDIALAYGVDHTKTGQAVYDNIIIYGSKYFDGFGGLTNAMMARSARQFMSDTSIADKFYAYAFARKPIPGNPYVFIVPPDPNKTLSGINVEDSVFLCTRLYVNSVTKIGPDPLEVVLDRFILLRPKTPDVPEPEIQSPAIKVYPNPAKGKAMIEILVPEWSDLELSLYNSSGQPMKQHININHVRGKVLQEVNFGIGYSTGTYFLRVLMHETETNNKQVLTSRVIVL
jgi:hypothetical protein